MFALKGTFELLEEGNFEMSVSKEHRTDGGVSLCIVAEICL